MSTRIDFEGNRAVSVRYTKGRSKKEHRVWANEIISCSGAINTPQLLQLSGVELRTTSRVLASMWFTTCPGVGENMQDHLEVYIQHACTQPVSMYPAMQWWNKPFVGYQWLFHRKGAAASNHFEAGGFIRSNEDGIPEFQFHFLPVAVRYDGTSPSGGHGYQVHVGPMNSEARGSVKIRSTDPKEHPALRFNYLSEPEDRREWVEAVRTARHILGQSAMDPFNGGEISPGPEVQTDEEILDWVRADGETALHPSCTAKMGIDEMAVVDPGTFKVHGLEGLRVVDASVMPYITNGNIYAPVMMIAERAADAITGATPLPPEHPPTYHHSQENSR